MNTVKTDKVRVLFVCTMGRLRSRTAAHCVAGFETDYAGTDREADKQITKAGMDWADIIVCMEKSHRNKLRRKFKGYSGKMLVWHIPDVYDYMEDALVCLCRGKAGRLNNS